MSAYRLHRGLLLHGHESSMFVLEKSSQDETVMRFHPSMDVTSRLRRRFRRKSIAKAWRAYAATRPSGYELFSQDRTPIGDALARQLVPCDVVHLHWVATFLDYESFFTAVPRERPVVWTLHDMNLVTGGCHYDMECGRYRSGCEACPQLGSRHSHDLSAEVWQRKRRIFAEVPPSRLCVVTPSRWLTQVVKDSPIFSRFRVETIPYGLDLDAFAPRDRLAAREVLGIPQDANVVLFVAEMIDNKRKGYTLLMDALTGCLRENRRLWLLSVGHRAPLGPGSMQAVHMGYVNNERFLSLVYSAADIFVIPSLQDNLPNTVLEAMACGVPVVGFDVGGISDMVRECQTGCLVGVGDVVGLQRAISRLMQDQELRTVMSKACRRVALDEYGLERQAQAYSDLYRTLS
ncbi:Glycosyl transferase family 1 [Nitrospira tepida]|uniref:Glycosyl transferase family 1 n=1 Tax=Nitrospira tepida TaxID=2973512 RepID=A0AA86T951_9BACT|nr:glycosyltransferase family 4 protein [Nitrospira tepida]CAI4032568.1 Glycosyl transferase family 1 [Nitrospira tepida]